MRSRSGSWRGMRGVKCPGVRVIYGHLVGSVQVRC